MNICLKCGEKIKRGQSKYGLHMHCFINWFELSASIESVDFMNLDQKRTSTKSKIIDIEKRKDTFYHGMFLKYSASLNGSTYILKIQESDYPELPHVEFLCNKIATILGLDVPPFYLINFQGRITFVTKNFMSEYTGALNHIYKFLPKGEEYHTCEEIIKVIFKETNRISEVKKFIDMCLFDAFIGNNDRHGRNIGIITEARSKKLAPMYDNPCFLGIQEEFLLGAHFNPSGSIGVQNTREPKPKDYIEEFIRLGYTDITQKFLKILSKNKKSINEAVEQSIMSSARKEAFIKLIDDRYVEMINA